FVRTLVSLSRPGGLISIVATNRDALAMRAGMEGDLAEARRLFDADRYRNGVGALARADHPEELGETLRNMGAEPVAWYGVRLFCDAWRRGETRSVDPDDLIEAEWEASRRDPYRRLSRLFHIVAIRGEDG